MPLEEASVVNEKRLFVPVPVAQLKAVVYELIDKERLVEGLVKDDQLVPTAPGAVQVGEEPAPADVKT